MSAAALLALAGCRKDESVVRDTDKIDRWVYRTLAENYLWSSQMAPLETTDPSMSPERYFETLRYRADRSVAVADDIYGDRFSALKYAGPATRGGESFSDTKKTDFGFEVRYFTGSDGIRFCQILYVLPGSPAERAGIRRGDRFNGIDESTMPMSRSVYSSLMAAQRVTLRFNYPQKRDVTLEKGEYYDTPVLYRAVFETSPRTGYLVFNHFTPGEGDRFLNELDDAFRYFREQGIAHLVLDLRYNGGGELTVARRLASLIARREMLGQVLVYKEYNRCFGNPAAFEAERFLTEGEIGAYNADVRRLCVITSENTASASELIIHGLKPYYGEDLIVIGETTVGKNVGGVEITDSRYEWEVHPITVRIYDRDKVSGYETGIVPELPELAEATYDRPDIGALGDAENDPLLRRALARLAGGEAASAGLLSPQGSVPVRSGGGATETSLPERGLIEARKVVY